MQIHATKQSEVRSFYIMAKITLPMKGKSTQESSKKEKILSPKQSTIDFLRLFARIYTCDIEINDNKRLILN